jgi:hypothetical protein
MQITSNKIANTMTKEISGVMDFPGSSIGSALAEITERINPTKIPNRRA